MSTPVCTALASTDGCAIGVLSVGAGTPLVIVGGALSTASDYLPLAEALADRFEVHVMERRGRGASGPQGADYGLAREQEDLQAVLSGTGARAVFGHSYGGLVALEAARRASGLERLALYEPGVDSRSRGEADWLDESERLLAAGDARGAFTEFVRHAGHAPAALRWLPRALVTSILRLAIRGEEWADMEPLMASCLREHREVMRLAGSLERYGSLQTPLLVLAGARSPALATRSLHDLAAVAPNVRVETMAGLRHDSPQGAGARAVADRIRDFLDEPPQHR